MTSVKHLQVFCLVVGLAAFVALQSGQPAEAHHCKGGHASDPECGAGGGGGGGSGGEVLYQVTVADDTSFDSEAPVYNPTCDAFTVEQKGPGVSYSAIFDRHDLCASVTTSDGKMLTDDIVVRVTTDSAGEITAVQLTGQDTIGKEGVFHESDVIELYLPVFPDEAGFTIIVNRDNVQIYKCDRHTSCRNRLESIGEIALDLMIYSPVP